jgi:hypothetical protein
MWGYISSVSEPKAKSKPQLRNLNILKITIRIKGQGNFNQNG